MLTKSGKERYKKPKAGWQNGYAEDCKSLYVGSIPVPASNLKKRWNFTFSRAIPLSVPLFPGSSVVEQTTVNRLVAGSNPARGAILDGSIPGRSVAHCGRICMGKKKSPSTQAVFVLCGLAGSRRNFAPTWHHAIALECRWRACPQKLVERRRVRPRRLTDNVRRTGGINSLVSNTF